MVKPPLLYGAKLRASLRKAGEKKAAAEVRQKMNEWMPQYMPVLLEQVIVAEEYELQLKAFTTFIQAEFRDIKRLRLCYQYITSTIGRGNTSGRWNLRVPANLIKVRRSKSSRTASFFRTGAEVGRLYKAWRDDIRMQTAPPANSAERLADVLISAVIHCGLANPHAVASLANTLTGYEKVFKSNEGLLWVDLIWSSDSDPLNYEEFDGATLTKRTLYRFYPNSFTLGLINSFYNCKDRHGIKKVYDTKNTWDLIRQRLSIASVSTTITKLSRFCAGAQSVTEMLENVEIPQILLECAAGRQNTSSLIPHHHEEWLIRSPIQKQTTPIAFLKMTPWDNIIPTDINNGTVRLRHGSDTLSAQIRSALQVEEKGVKRSSSEATAELKLLLNEDRNANERILVAWLINCLSTNKVSTAQRYFVEVKDLWFYFAGDRELGNFDESDFESLYELMLSLKDNPKAKEYLRGRLSDLHAFASKSYGLPKLTEFFADSGSIRNQIHVKAGYIPELAYRAVLHNIDNIDDLDPHTVKGLKLMIALAYRTGLRRGELLKLRLSDVESSLTPWLFIVNNRYGNNKTDSALRKIPLYPLLLEKELEAFRNYLGKRRAAYPNQPNTLLFSLPHTVTTPHKGNSVSELVKNTLVQQGYFGLTFHHLRHSALTNLMLVMDGNDQLIEALTTYTKEHAELIRKTLFSTNPESKRDAYWTIAGIAGHLTPQTTFTNYIHITDIILSRRLAAYDPELTLTESRYISGLSSRYLNEHRAKKAVASSAEGEVNKRDANEETFHLAEFSEQIRQKLAPKISKIKAAKAPELKQQIDGPKQSRSANVTDCYSVLKDIENGDSVVVVSIRYAVDEELIIGWIETAKHLQKVTTIHGNARLFSKGRVDTAIGEPLLPARPKDRSEAVEIDKMINALRGAFVANKEDVLWVIHYWLKNSMASKSGIRFTNHAELVKFIDILEGAIPLKRWHLNLVVPHKADKTKLIAWKSCGLGAIVETGLATGKNIHAYLHLRHADEANILAKRKAKMSRYSSSLMRYIFHMLAIMIGVRLEDMDYL